VSAFEKWALWVSSVVVALTGGVYAWMKYMLTTGDPYAVVHHPLQPLILKIHILAAPVLVFAIGAVYSRHVMKQWQRGSTEGRRSGTATLAIIVPMIVSGYLLQTSTAPGWLFGLAMIHLAAGTLYLGSLVAHQWGARSRRAEPEA
jgi:hypothetical protein